MKWFRTLLLLLFVFLSGCFPIVKRQEIVIQGGTYTSGLTISESNIVLDGADVSNVSGGVCLKITGDNVTVRNSVIHDCKDHGVQFLGTNGGLFENNEVYRAAMRYEPNTVSGGWQSLVKVQSVDESSAGLAHDIVIQNNYIHEGYGECIGLRGYNLTVVDNHLMDCYSIGIYTNGDRSNIMRNFVQCTGNPEFNRSGLPMVGISAAEEQFTNWGAHGHDRQIVLNNIVTGCRNGFRYGSSVNGKGLTNSVIAFNTFSRATNASIAITYYSSQADNLIENNIVSSGILANLSGNTVIGNLRSEFTSYAVPEDFKLLSSLPALGPYKTARDYGNFLRVEPFDTGAWDYRPVVPSTPTFVPTQDLCKDGVPDFIERASGLYYYCTYPVPTGYSR